MNALEKFGGYVKDKRIALGLTLRKFCDQNGYDPGNHSKLERARRAVPQSREALGKLARALGIVEKTDIWYEFFDLASAAQGVIPPDILEDEEALKIAPLLFRTLRGNTISEEKLRQLLDKIKEG